MDNAFDWEFTHRDGRKRRFNEDLPDAYYQLMKSEDFDLHDMEEDAWIGTAKRLLPEVEGLELQIDDSSDKDTYEHGTEPGAWVELKGRIWVPLEKTLETTGAATEGRS